MTRTPPPPPPPPLVPQAMALMLPHSSQNPAEDNTVEGRLANMSQAGYLPVAKSSAELSDVLDQIKVRRCARGGPSSSTLWAGLVPAGRPAAPFGQGWHGLLEGCRHSKAPGGRASPLYDGPGSIGSKARAAAAQPPAAGSPGVAAGLAAVA